MDTEVLELERSLARRRTRHGFSRDEAIAGWERILDAAPDDSEALEALIELLQYPGVESRRLAYLEQLARIGTPQDPERWLEAAGLRWRMLRDASEALADLDAALALDASSVSAHELRAEICAHLGRADEEAASLHALVQHEAEGPAAAHRWLRLAELALRSVERRDEARLAAERALAASPELDGLRLQACAVFQQIGEWQRACDLLHAELESAKGDSRAELLGDLSRIEWDERRRAEPACAAFVKLEAERELEAEECDRWADALAALEQWPEALGRRREALSKLANAVGDGVARPGLARTRDKTVLAMNLMALGARLGMGHGVTPVAIHDAEVLEVTPGTTLGNLSLRHFQVAVDVLRLVVLLVGRRWTVA